MCKTLYVDKERISPLPRPIEKKKVIKVPSPITTEEGRIRDALEILTMHTKNAFNEIGALYANFKSTAVYTILTRTTQPATLIVLLAVVFLGAVLYPVRDAGSIKSSGFKFMYVITTATHYGVQIWMTFISGLALYFNLPRHDFGEVQKVLFPLYFTFTGLVSAGCIFSQARLSGINGATLLLIVCFLVEILVRTRLCGPLVSLINRKNAVEAKHGLGREVGKLASNSELFSTPSYLVLHNKFRRLHALIAVANMTCIGLSTAHIWVSLSGCGEC